MNPEIAQAALVDVVYTYPPLAVPVATNTFEVAVADGTYFRTGVVIVFVVVAGHPTATVNRFVLTAVYPL
jgi:hypothetical protein